MNHNYVIKLKPDNDSISAYLNEIKELYSQMKEFSIYNLIDNTLNVNDKFTQSNKYMTLINDLLNEQNEHLQKLILTNKLINKNLINLCNHEIITDTIDIDLDRSKTIEYCKICGITK